MNSVNNTIILKIAYMHLLLVGRYSYMQKTSIKDTVSPFTLFRPQIYMESNFKKQELKSRNKKIEHFIYPEMDIYPR